VLTTKLAATKVALFPGKMCCMPINPPTLLRFIALATFTALAFTRPTSAAPIDPLADQSTSPPTADSQVTAKAREWFHRLQSGEIDRSQLDAQVNSQLTDGLIRQEADALTPLGDPSSFVYLRTYPMVQALEYDFLLQFKTAQLVELISFDPGGKIEGLAFEPVAATR
jgi:hypothetical protein